jgi:L-asparaginase
MYHRQIKRCQIGFLAVLLPILFAWTPAAARELGKPPNVMILATGGTIAGSGAASTTTVGYTAATVAVETLINAERELQRRRLPRMSTGSFFLKWTLSGKPELA